MSSPERELSVPVPFGACLAIAVPIGAVFGDEQNKKGRGFFVFESARDDNQCF